MAFWIFFVCVCIGFLFLERIIPERYKRFVPMALMMFITFIAAFRYQIGWDYDNYVELFYKTEIGDPYPEITLQWVAVFLRDYGFDYQALFVAYSLLTSLFLWWGICFYFNKPRYIIFAILVFVFIKVLYWDLMFGYIRQGLAGTIFFWGTQFVLKRQFCKYLCTIIVCGLIHFSSVVLILAYLVPSITLNRRKILILIFLSIPLYAVSLPVMNLLMDYLGFYQSLLGHGAVRTTLIVNSVIGITLITLYNSEVESINKQQRFVFNMYSLSVILGILLGFSVATYRMSVYFQLFQILVPIYLVNDFKSNSKYLFQNVVIVSLALIWLAIAYTTDNVWIDRGTIYLSPNNINYAFNFKLF